MNRSERFGRFGWPLMKAAGCRLLSGYGLVIALAAAMIFYAGVVPGVRTLDGWMFGVSQQMTRVSLPSVPVVVMRLSHDPAQPQQAARTAFDQLRALTSRGLFPGQSDAAAVVVDERLRNALVWSDDGERLLRRYRSVGVRVGIPAADLMAPGALNWPGAPADTVQIADGYQSGVLKRALPNAPVQRLLRLEALADSAPLALPVFDATGMVASRPLVWLAGDVHIPDLAARLYADYAGAQEPVVFEGDRLWLGPVTVPTDPQGRVYPRFSHAAGALPEFVDVPVGDVLAGKDRPAVRGRVVIVGLDNDPVVDDLAAAVASLHGPAIAHTPSWGIVGEKGLTLLFCVYLLLVVPLVRPSVAMLLTVLIAVVTVTAQMGVLLVFSQWPNFAAPLAFLVIGHGAVHLVSTARKRRRSLIRHTDEARIALARRQLEDGDLDGALAGVEACVSSEALLELLYDVGIAFERKRHYDRAAVAFYEVTRRRRGYRDVADRLTVLAELSPEGSWASSLKLGKSPLVLPNKKVAKPVLGRYEIERELGRGSMGVVYLGRDPKIGRKVAIKTLDLTQLDEEPTEFKARFFREAEAAGGLSHPNIVTIYDVGEEKDLAFYAMDYMPGRALSAYTEPEQMLDIPRVCHLIAQIADGLDYAHRQGVVHRDIKPHNLIFDDDDGRVKITDFGIARLGDTTWTRTGAFMGSPSYMSPEQITGKPVDGRSDIFSLGVTLFQLLTAELPFQGDTLASLAYQISNQKHPDVRKLRKELPAAMTKIINKALQKDPGKRFQRASELAEALRKAVGRGATSEA